MHKVHLYAELFVQVFGQVLCRIYGAMLPACAAEAYGETGEAAFHVSLYGSIYQSVYVFKENGYFPVFFEETDNGFVKSGERLIAFVLAGIVYGAAVEYKAAAIAGGVFGDSFLFNAIQEKIRKISRSVDMGGQLCEKRNERLSTFIHSTNKNSEEWAQEKRRDRNCN